MKEENINSDEIKSELELAFLQKQLKLRRKLLKLNKITQIFGYCSIYYYKL